MREGHFFFPYSLKRSSDRPIPLNSLREHTTSSADITRVIRCRHSFRTPTNLSMPPQVACGRRICGAQIPPNVSAILTLPLANLGATLENVSTAAINVVNHWSWLKKSIDWCVPLLQQPLYRFYNEKRPNSWY